MPSLVFLNGDGTFHKKLQLVSLPKEYVVPEGKILSWRHKIVYYLSHPTYEAIGYRCPLEAYFYLGSAWAQIERVGFEDRTFDGTTMRYNVNTLVITVQSTSAQDLMSLRDYILTLFDKHLTWGVYNNLNPEPGFIQRIKNRFRKTSR